MIGKTISHYRVIEKLGEGGMGIVYKAQDIKLQRLVALKFLPENLTRDAEAKARLMQEARAAAALNHPNICTIYEIDASEGRLFLALEYVAWPQDRYVAPSEIVKVYLALDDKAQALA